MDVHEQLELACGSADLYAVVADLGRYPEWLSIVSRAEPLPSRVDVADGSGPAWSVDLRGRLGPFSRSKRLRMVRTVADAPVHARFERDEADGRDHSPWVLDARIEDVAAGSLLRMHLHYGGSLWVPVLDRLLANEIERSKPRLAGIVVDSGGQADQTR